MESINKCLKCGERKFATNKKVLVCVTCGYPKTKRGIEKFTNLEIIK